MVDISDLYSWWDSHEGEYIKDLSDYVAIPSIAVKESGEYPFGKPCYDMLVFIKGLMDRYYLNTRLIKNAFAEGVLNGKENKHTVAIACHGDVVPVSGKWERDPFTLFQKEDHLVGRGTTDNKGAGMASLYALRYLISKGWNTNTTFKILFGSAEEIGMFDYDIAFKGEKIADLTLVPDSGFPVSYGEKGSMKYTFSLPFDESKIRNISGGSAVGVADFASAEIKAKASICNENIEIEELSDGWYRIKAKGKGKHSATPEGGVDAFAVLFGYISNLIDDDGVNAYLKLFPDFYGTGTGINIEDKESGALTAVVTVIRDGRFQLNIRLPLSADHESVKEKLSKVLPECKLESSTTGYRMPLDERIMALNKIANDEYGANKEPYVMAGGTYARVMQPAVAFGMGSPLGNAMPPFPQGEGRAHQINESVHLMRMRNGFAIYVKALLFLEESYNGK